MMGLLARASTTPSPYTVPPSQKFDGNDGSWSTFKISVGTPGQDFRVLPSTKSAVTNVILPGGCQPEDPSNCRQLRGIEIFNSAQNAGFQVNASSSWSTIGQYDVNTEQALGLSVGALFGFDKVALGAAAGTNVLSMDRQVVGGMEKLDYFLGFLPLGQADSSFSSLSQSIDSFLYQMRNKTMIPSFSYAYTAGAKYMQKGGVFGNLILGGYDSTRFKPNDNQFSFTFSQDPSRLLGIGVESITATNSLKGTYSLSSGAHLSVIDSTVPHLWLPRAICDQFEQAFGLTYDPKTDLYLVNNTVHQQLISNNPTVTFKLVNTPGSTTNYTNIQLPYGAFDLQASYPFYSNATNYFPIRRAQNDTQYVLGRTLLQEAYLIVDYERGNFSVAQAVFPDPLPAAKVVTIHSKADASNANGSSGLATGAIIGIAVGAAVLVFAAIFAFFILRRRRTKKQQRYELANSQVSDGASGRYLNASATPMKSQGPSELNGTPLTELASPMATPHYPSDQKSAVSINEMPAELHAESRTPVTPRWQEVHMPLQPPRTPNDDAISSGSRSVSQLPSDDGYPSAGDIRSAVSPMTGQFGHQNPSFHR